MKLKIRTKILVVFLGLFLIALALFGYMALRSIQEIGTYALESSRVLGDRAVKDSTSALEHQAEDHLQRLARDQAALSNALFEKVEGEVNTAAHIASALWISPSQPVYERFLQEEIPEDVLERSAYVLAPGVAVEEVREELNLLRSLDRVFIPLHANDANLTWIYIGTESGILQMYPWASGMDPSYDPRVRAWYRRAQETNSIGWSDPYIDVVTGELMVTCSEPVYDAEGNLVAVVAADVTTETINEKIINLPVGELGYAFLIDNAGNTVAQPGLVPGDRRWDETFETENLLQSDNPRLKLIAEDMIAGSSGIARCSFEDGEKYLAYAPITSTNWSIGVVMPVDEIVEPVVATQRQIFAASATAAQDIRTKIQTMRGAFIAFLIAMVVVVSGISVVLARTITKPIVALTQGAKIIGKGQLDHTVRVTTGDELEELAHSFNTMAEDLRGYLEELQRTTAEKERLRKELEIAHGIQQSFLPRTVPEIQGMQLAASNLPAQEVGGDFYDFIPITKDLWGLVIADVSGKGIPAALFMALSRTLVRASTTRNPAAAHAIAQANELICEDSQSNNMFVTLFYAILDSRKKTLRYVNAGHNPPLLLRGAPGGEIVLLKAKGIALGVIDDIQLGEETIQLSQGDIVALYTDGVTEAINKQTKEFGQKRFASVIAENSHLPADEIIQKIEEAITRFAGEQPQFDDITTIILKVT